MTFKSLTATSPITVTQTKDSRLSFPTPIAGFSTSTSTLQADKRCTSSGNTGHMLVHLIQTCLTPSVQCNMWNSLAAPCLEITLDSAIRLETQSVMDLNSKNIYKMVAEPNKLQSVWACQCKSITFDEAPQTSPAATSKLRSKIRPQSHHSMDDLRRDIDWRGLLLAFDSRLGECDDAERNATSRQIGTSQDAASIRRTARLLVAAPPLKVELAFGPLWNGFLAYVGAQDCVG
ncbi:hypothetical protein BC835DRAFT_1306775 [Cytidiella melzeri]|nr:hypothetical protein BC835DRAFT_1306775 [Cytidiella melzeri]